ncbi:MAG: class I SAM-dependent methyltransferase [Leptospirales bacterium]|nr:class I SAM-dependent methyltransferase [Leptospirales bacterium]
MNAVKQFSKPEGFLGRLAGRLMAFKNRKRGKWAMELLELKPTLDILEIGFGSGRELGRIAESVASGKILGLDHSHVMRQQAEGRNRKLVKSGRMNLKTADVGSLLSEISDRNLDRVYAINSWQFWPDQTKAILDIKTMLKPGGMALIVFQARGKDANDAASRAGAVKLKDQMEKAGFKEISVYEKDLSPTIAVAVRGVA